MSNKREVRLTDLKDFFVKNKLLLVLAAVCTVFVLVVAIVLGVIITNEDTEKPPETDAPEELFVPSVLDDSDPINGVWIASVFNINFPSTASLTESALKAELDDIVLTTKNAGLNTIFFQVRPESDSLYESDIYPVSKYLSRDGVLTLDALEYIVEKAHSEGISVHAWINPVRVTSSSSVEIDDLSIKNPARIHPEYTVKYADGKIYYNLGIPEVRELICDGVEEIVENYDVDGIVFDDYFYPYPVYSVDESGASVAVDFEDRDAYTAYNANGLDIADWRRDNVNRLIKAVFDTVKSADKDCLFGVSPFGIWKNGYGDESGSLTSGNESYKTIYCDSLAFIKGGYVDYIAPQLYWKAEQESASYTVLCDWWAEMVKGTKVRLLVCHGAYRYDNDWESPEGVMTSQVLYARNKELYRGSLFYGYEALKNNINGLYDEIKELYLGQE